MEAVTAGTEARSGGATGSKTIADLLPRAVEKYGDAPAQRSKHGEEWKDVSYAELGEKVKEVALGLIDLGIQPGDKISILAHTRPEWTDACFGILTAGSTLVTIYQTNSPEECRYVLAHSDSRAVFVEDGEQLAKIREIEDECPELRHVIVLDPGDADLGDAITLEQLRERSHGRDAAEWSRRYEAVTPADICLYIYTSGTTGPPKGCLLSHANYRAITDAVVEDLVLEEGDSSYLFLPLAHAFAILIQFATFDLGSTLAYWSRDPKMIIADIAQVSPTFFPSVPRMFEKIYTLATSSIEGEEGLAKAVQVGVKVRMMKEAGEEVPAELQQGFDQAEEKLFKNVRGLFGQNMRECVTGAAPIAPEILRFFFACGVPVMEGYGMTETSTSATVNRPEGNNFRFGSVGKPQQGVEIRIADDGEVLIKGPNIFQGYYKNDDATEEALENGWLHTGDLGRLDEDGFLYITGRKKDIIITAGGKNITPANLENGLKQNRWISQAVVVGDRRPYLVALITLDPEEAPALARELGLDDAGLPALAQDEKVRAEVQKAVDEVNARVGPVEQIKRFEILDHDLSQETGELTPTLKVKRNVVHDKFSSVVERIYQVPANVTRALASNDPTDTGGLFIGRRPGTAPVRYREAEPSSPRRRTADNLLAHALLAVELVLCLSLLGPQPAGWLWVGSQVDYLTGYITAGIATIMLGCLASLMLTMAFAKRVDHAWKLVRRAAGHRQERGALERIFASSVAVALVVFAAWFLFVEGPGPSLAPTN